MYVIVWEYEVDKDNRDKFEQAYGPNGVWVEFFKSGKGYISTELLRKGNEINSYITIDRWESKAAYHEFCEQWLEEYKRIDFDCEKLTLRETCIGMLERLGYSSYNS